MFKKIILWFCACFIPHKGPCVFPSYWIYIFLAVFWFEVCRSLISWRMVLLKCLIFPGILQLLFFSVFHWRPLFPKEIKLYVPKMDSLDILGTSLRIQWLRFCLAVQRTWVLSLVGELRSCLLYRAVLPCPHK